MENELIISKCRDLGFVSAPMAMLIRESMRNRGLTNEQVEEVEKNTAIENVSLVLQLLAD